MKKQKLYILGTGVILVIILGVIFRDKIKKWFTGEQYFYIDDEEETCMICLEGSNYTNTEDPNSSDFNINYGPLLEVCSAFPGHKAHNKCITDWIIKKGSGQELGNIYAIQEFNFNYRVNPELATCPSCRSNLKLIYYLGVSQFLMNQLDNINLTNIGREIRGLVNRPFNMSNEQISNFKREHREEINEIEQNMINFQRAELENVRRNQPQPQQPQQPQAQQPNLQERNENEAIINTLEQLLPFLRQRNFEDLFNFPNIFNIILEIANNIVARNYIRGLPDADQLIINFVDFQEYANERLIRQRELREEQERIQNNLRIQELQQQMQQREQQRQRELEEQRQQRALQERQQRALQEYQRDLRAIQEFERERQIVEDGLNRIRQIEKEDMEREKEAQEFIEKEQKEIKKLQRQIQLNENVSKLVKDKTNTQFYIIGGIIVIIILFFIFKNMNKKRK